MPPIGITNIIINLSMVNVRDLANGLSFLKTVRRAVASIILIIIYDR